jgi:hypothetical protein
MEKPSYETLDRLISQLAQNFGEIEVKRRVVTPDVAILDVECVYHTFRVIISEIIETGKRKYAYLLLDTSNDVVVIFDNSPDWKVAQLKYGVDYRTHCREWIPHQHSYKRQEINLTTEMTLTDFLTWIENQFPKYLNLI